MFYLLFLRNWIYSCLKYKIIAHIPTGTIEKIHTEALLAALLVGDNVVGDSTGGATTFSKGRVVGLLVGSMVGLVVGNEVGLFVGASVANSHDVPVYPRSHVQIPSLQLPCEEHVRPSQRST